MVQAVFGVVLCRVSAASTVAEVSGSSSACARWPHSMVGSSCLKTPMLLFPLNEPETDWNLGHRFSRGQVEHIDGSLIQGFILLVIFGVGEKFSPNMEQLASTL